MDTSREALIAFLGRLAQDYNLRLATKGRGEAAETLQHYVEEARLLVRNCDLPGPTGMVPGRLAPLAPPPPTRIAIAINKGMLVGVYSNRPVLYALVDYDNINAGDAPPDLNALASYRETDGTIEACHVPEPEDLDVEGGAM